MANLPPESQSIKFKPLTNDQIEHFHEQGYLILTDILPDQEATKLAVWMREVKETTPLRGTGAMPYMEVNKSGKLVLTSTENFCNTHSNFNSLLRSPSLLNVLSQLTSDKMHLFKEKINYKQPSAGGFAPHLDAPAFTHLTTRPLTVLFVVEDMTIENGCLEIVPGSHKGDVPIALDNCIPEDWVNRQNWVPVPLKAGQVMIFGSYLAHRSGDNHSPYGRAAVYGTYNCDLDGGDIHDAYYEHRRKIWPPTHERIEGERYQEGALLYGFGSPMLTVQIA